MPTIPPFSDFNAWANHNPFGVLIVAADLTRQPWPAEDSQSAGFGIVDGLLLPLSKQRHEWNEEQRFIGF